MASLSPEVVTFSRRLVAHVAGQRSYLSFGERDKLVATVAQFSPTYNVDKLSEDILFRNVDLLRVALGEVADIGGSAASYSLAATIQAALADNRLDEDDLALIHWVGDALGFERAKVDRAIERVDGPLRPIGAVPVDPALG